MTDTGQEIADFRMTPDQAHPKTDWASIAAHRWLIRFLMATLRQAVVR